MLRPVGGSSSFVQSNNNFPTGRVTGRSPDTPSLTNNNIFTWLCARLRVFEEERQNGHPNFTKIYSTLRVDPNRLRSPPAMRRYYPLALGFLLGTVDVDRAIAASPLAGDSGTWATRSTRSGQLRCTAFKRYLRFDIGLFFFSSYLAVQIIHVSSSKSLSFWSANLLLEKNRHFEITLYIIDA